MKDRDHLFVIFKVKETFLTIHAQKGSLEVKRGVMSIYSQASSLESNLAKRCMLTHGRILRYAKQRVRTRQNEKTAKGNLEKCLMYVIQTTKGA